MAEVITVRAAAVVIRSLPDKLQNLLLTSLRSPPGRFVGSQVVSCSRSKSWAFPHRESQRNLSKERSFDRIRLRRGACRII